MIQHERYKEWEPALGMWRANAPTAEDAVNAGPVKIGEALVCTRINVEPFGKGWMLKAEFARKADSTEELRLENARLRYELEKLKQQVRAENWIES